MQSEDEVTKCHDVLVQLILNPEVLGAVIDPRFHGDLKRYAECLCWVLEHPHNPTFANNMGQIFERLELLGLEVCQYPEPQNREAK